MNTHRLVAMLAGVAVSSMIGCSDDAAQFDQSTSANEALVRDVFNRQTENAILAEHAVYPHHFETDGSALSELGERHLEVIASRYRTVPGRLVVVRGDVPQELYEARVDVVVRSMADAGVDPGRLNVANETPGGQGMPSWRVIEIRQQPAGLSGDDGRGMRMQTTGRQ